MPENVRTVDGVHYLTEIKRTELVCDNFTLTRNIHNYTQETIDPDTGAISRVKKNDLPPNDYFWARWRFADYVDITIDDETRKVPDFTDKIVSTRISKARTYVWNPVKCLQGDRVLMTLYSGGNCTNECEAWAIAEFGRDGKIVDTEALIYPEYKLLNEGALDPRHGAYLNMPDYMDYKDGRWQYDLACKIDPPAEPRTSLLKPALPRLKALPPGYEGGLESNQPLEESYVAYQLGKFETNYANGSPLFKNFPNYVNYEQITSDMTQFNSVRLQGYTEDCTFCPRAQIDEYVFKSDDCAEKWHSFALDMNTQTKAVGFIRKQDNTIILSYPSAYYMLGYLPDIEKAIFGDIDPNAAYQKAEPYLSPADRYFYKIPK